MFLGFSAGVLVDFKWDLCGIYRDVVVEIFVVGEGGVGLVGEKLGDNWYS
jgi:hypothetical protein